MKKLFFTGIIGLIIFELLNVYFIMPFPGSQKMNSIDLAYFLYSCRWVFRTFFCVIIVVGVVKSKWKWKWLPWLVFLVSAAIIFAVNFIMSADRMFYQTKQLVMMNVAVSKVDHSQLIIGVEKNGEAKAYPVQYIGYHHQVLDSLGGNPIMVTYCTVCRTGRVYEPKVDGKYEKFRLVGMDHFNAMFEDGTTKSWWRQVNGEAITGKLKGKFLPEFLSTQTSLKEWLQLHPKSLIMQPDLSFSDHYASLKEFESGKAKGALTGTDTSSWKDKSWVIGIKAGKLTKAYDWNKLKSLKIIHDKIGDKPVMLVLSTDQMSFFAFERMSDESRFTIDHDTLIFNGNRYRLDGTGIDSTDSLKRLPAYQEFWHSWRTFNEATKVD